MNAFGLFAIIPILIYLAIIIFIIYFIVMALVFMREKTAADKARNEKLDEIVKALNRNKMDE